MQPGIIYITAMDRPDAALALAMLYRLQSKHECRIGAVCVDGSGLGAAIFCDIVNRFYLPGRIRNSNEALPVGFAAGNSPAADPQMVKAVVARQYLRGIKRVADTSLAEAVIRNAVTFSAESIMILSAPATSLAQSLDLRGAKDLYKERVKTLVVVEAGAPRDPAAMHRVLTEFPAPVVFCSQKVGETLLWPGSTFANDFSWTAYHPIVDACGAFNPGTYDAPTHDMAAMLHGVRPGDGLFLLSDSGTLAVSDGRQFQFTRGGAGNVRSLIVDPARQDEVVRTYVELASAKPFMPRQRPNPA